MKKQDVKLYPSKLTVKLMCIKKKKKTEKKKKKIFMNQIIMMA